MYQVYGMPMTRATRVTWALEEIGADYQYHLVDLMKGEGQSPEFLRLNPSGKVPVLVHDDLILTESAAICSYLGDQHPEAELVPPVGSSARGRYDQWSYYVLTELEQPLWTIGKHQFVFPEDKKVPAIIDVACWEFKRAASVLANYLEGKNYLVDDAFTMADIHAAHTLIWARAFKIPHDQDLLADYEQKIGARAALARAKEREKAAKS